MADLDTETTVENSDSEELELDQESMEKIRKIAGLGVGKDRNGRRGAIVIGDHQPGNGLEP